MTLTNRQHQILRHVRLGYTNKQIGNSLGIKPESVKVRLYEMYRDIGLKNRADAAAWYVRENTERNK